MKESGFTPGSTIAINSELAAPTLRRGETYPQQMIEYSGSCTGGHRVLKDLQDLR